MRVMNMKRAISKTQLLLAIMLTALLLAPAAFAAVPGITGPNFNLTARAEYLSQPDGSAIYSWGYGCNGAPTGFAPAAMSGAFCKNMQVPGPTLIVTQGQTVTIHLTNNLPNAAGNTSILFPGFIVSTSCTAERLGTARFVDAAKLCQADPSLIPSRPQRRHALILQRNAGRPADGNGTVRRDCCGTGPYTLDVQQRTSRGESGGNAAAQAQWGETDFRLAAAAYDHPSTCYDREYIFQFSEMDPRIHREAEAAIYQDLHWLHERSYRALRCRVLHDQRPFHAR